MVEFRRSPLGAIAVIALSLALVLGGLIAYLARGPKTSPGGHVPLPSSSVALSAPPPCVGAGRTLVRPLAHRDVAPFQWQVGSPPGNATYDLSGVTSTAYPSTRSPFAVGTNHPGVDTCVVGGTVLGRAADNQPWELYHSDYNAACVTIVALGWAQVRDLRCDDLEDGIRPKESSLNANNSSVYVTGTYLTRIRDDCIENDFTLGGLLQDNLWEQCNTGVSERPAGSRSWRSPPSETLTLDHMLIGLYQTPHDKGGTTRRGENALFKWSSSANHLVIKCSIFKVDADSLNGPDAMAVPAGTVVDDSQCPSQPTTIVWLGGGKYPALTAGIRVVTDPAVWQNAVTAWKTAHGVF
jgi:hypothetical protein